MFYESCLITLTMFEKSALGGESTLSPAASSIS
jgi:hypothetical protein